MRTPKGTLKIKARTLRSREEKIRGLIGQKKLYPVYFETRFGIHTFGMEKPIDVFILDNNYSVVRIKKGIKPDNVFFWNPRYSKVLETPTDYLKIKILDKVIIT